MSNATKKDVPIDLNIPDNYVQHTLTTTKPLPPISLSNVLNEINWLPFTVMTTTPIMGVIGAYYTKLRWETAIWAIVYYYITGLGITAGYHRLWSHRSYNAAIPLQYILAIAGTGSVEGSIKWWTRGHRAHHRYTDTDLDPYNAHRAHSTHTLAGCSSSLEGSLLSQTSALFYPLLTMGFLFPPLVAWLGWGDAKGGFVYDGVLRLVFVHHSTFCVNSLAHWLGETPFDNKPTPTDHMITAFATIGEGYHNFHHQFPMDYRNAIKWYQYDPTKWFIWSMQKIGLASHLKVFPENEVRKGQLTMQLKRLRETQESLTWPMNSDDLPVISFKSFQDQSLKRPLILISGFIHDVSTFMDEHPGGAHLLVKFIGKDATTAFFGGVYDHSNGAHNSLAMKRIGILHGGHPHILDIAKRIPPSQQLKIARYNELSSNYASSTAWSDEEGSAEGTPVKKLSLL
ncbi:delta 9-fatty acid desaturase protein [Desarmillaria tabescens]|uniref:Acyl-CoA desaturase n=1 Tax=Armillaria tabescens TaxID=1929756 RepID=A0AA39IX44_ARMTA|nr:delta 9-fatty acid desaturase protein [Desarmillaria tabescens]KAK0432097.1 delta 9-fatty acid desaturase protein [Desarmillaria tabescens]